MTAAATARFICNRTDLWSPATLLSQSRPPGTGHFFCGPRLLSAVAEPAAGDG